MASVFLEKYLKARKEKDSILCVGLDPGLRAFRSVDVVPEKYDKDDVVEGLTEFCLDVIEQTADYACAIKPNSQYLLFTLGLNQLKKINQKARKEGLISIIDHKLGDIGSTNEAAFYWIKEAGFDALTFSPFAGNIEEATRAAHKQELGLLVLTFMSNVEAEWIHKKTVYEWRPLFQKIAEEVKRFGSDGAIMGATNHVTMDDIRMVRSLIGKERLMLFPGVGKQGGSLRSVIGAGGENILVNVGRDIIYDKNPKEKAREYQQQMKQVIKEFKEKQA